MTAVKVLTVSSTRGVSKAIPRFPAAGRMSPLASQAKPAASKAAAKEKIISGMKYLVVLILIFLGVSLLDSEEFLKGPVARLKGNLIGPVEE